MPIQYAIRRVAKRQGPLFFFLILSSTFAFARVGETEPELVKRFGSPVVRSIDQIGAEGRMWTIGPQLTFKKDDWTIVCVLVDGRVGKESYGKRGQWTEDHLKTVLNANSQGAKWEETGRAGKKLAREWRRSDGATARWVSNSGMTIIVPGYERAKKVIEAKGKAEAGKPAKI